MSNMSRMYLDRESSQALAFSAIRYENVNLASNYEPEDYFRALYIETGGNLVITGIDGVEVTMLVGNITLFPFGGKKISSTSTVSGVTALF